MGPRTEQAWVATRGASGGAATTGARGLDQLVEGLVFHVVDEVPRPAREVGNGRAVGVEPQPVVERREHFLEMDRPLDGMLAQAIGGPDDLPGAQTPARKQRAADARPVIAAAVLVPARRVIPRAMKLRVSNPFGGSLRAITRSAGFAASGWSTVSPCHGR